MAGKSEKGKIEGQGASVKAMGAQPCGQGKAEPVEAEGIKTDQEKDEPVEAEETQTTESPEWHKKCCRILYRFREAGNRYSGSFVDFEGSFFIECFSDDKKAGRREFLWECRNEYLLRCYLLDKENHMVLYEDFDALLSEYISVRNKKAIKEEIIPHVLGVEVESVKTLYLDDFYKKLFKQMTHFLVHIHGENHFTTGFDISNIAIKGGKIKFFGLRFKHTSSFTQQCKRRAADFRALHNLIIKIVCESMNVPASIWPPLPGDFERFLALLRRPQDDICGLLPNHVGLMHSQERLCFLVAMSQKRDLIDRMHYKLAQLAMGDNRGWRERIVAQLGPVKDCYDETVMKIEKEVDIRGDGYLRANATLLRFIRNVAVHVAQHEPMYRRKLDHVFIDSVLMHLFAKPIWLFQEECYKLRSADGKPFLSQLQWWLSVFHSEGSPTA